MSKKFEKISAALLVFMLVLCGIMSLTPVYAQGNDISNLVVTALSVTPENIKDGDNFTVRVDFKENDQHDIQSGDMITVAWPQSTDGVSFSGYVAELPLKVQEKEVGKAIITQDGATVLFDENINKLQDVAGFVSFEVNGRNFTDTSEEDTKTGVLSAGNERAHVNVTKPKSGTTSVFYYKSGNMDSNDTGHVNWWLNANLNKAYVDREIRIEDEIQGGQALVENSFYITVTSSAGDERHFYGSGALSDFSEQYPGSSVTFAGNRIDVRIPRGYASLNHFSIYYRTVITESNQAYFYNNSKVWYQENGKEAVEGEESNASVKNISVGAGITGTVRGELRIFKRLEGTVKGIEGVRFELARVDGNPINGEPKVTLITNGEGIANIKGLEVGEYKFKEISAPEWIHFDPLEVDEFTFEVKDSDAEGKVFDIENKRNPVKASIELKKEVLNLAQVPSGQFYFTITGASDRERTVLAKHPNQENGQITVANDSSRVIFRDLSFAEAGEYYFAVTERQDAQNNQNGSSGINKQYVYDPGAIRVTVRVEEKDNRLVIAEDGIRYEKVQQDGAPETETNTFNNVFLGETGIAIRKKWQDPEGEAKTEGLPERIRVKLYADGAPAKYLDGSEVPEQEITAGDKVDGENWTIRIDRLPIYAADRRHQDATRNAITYTVKELYEGAEAEDGASIKADGKWYRVYYVASPQGGFTITNKEAVSWTPMIPPLREIAVTKIWQNHEGLALAAPVEKITVALYRDGIATGKKLELNASNNWSGAFKQLETVSELNADADYRYAVKEIGETDGVVQFDGVRYNVSYGGTMEDGFIITNEKEAPPTPPAPETPTPPTPETPQVPKTPPTSPGAEIPPTETEPKTPLPQGQHSPKTGVGEGLLPYAGLLLVSGSALVFVENQRRRKNQ
ncbi:MAG: Cna B-type domain-containing protein [Ndongobacter sp.]|nr:Cna B-type domain-containing protein [Ndongobacter sp.]